MAALNPEDVRVRHVRVTNNTDEVWSDRFDGVPVTLAPGQTETIPLDMAAHFFGYSPGVDQTSMLMHIAQRNAKTEGDWGVIRADLPTRQRVAESFFEKFKIEPVAYRLVEDKAAPPVRKSNEPVPAMTDEELDPGMREPTSVKEAVRSGMRDPEAEQQTTGRGHPRRDTHGRTTRRE